MTAGPDLSERQRAPDSNGKKTERGQHDGQLYPGVGQGQTHPAKQFAQDGRFVALVRLEVLVGETTDAAVPGRHLSSLI